MARVSMGIGHGMPVDNVDRHGPHGHGLQWMATMSMVSIDTVYRAWSLYGHGLSMSMVSSAYIGMVSTGMVSMGMVSVVMVYRGTMVLKWQEFSEWFD